MLHRRDSTGSSGSNGEGMSLLRIGSITLPSSMDLRQYLEQMQARLCAHPHATLHCRCACSGHRIHTCSCLHTRSCLPARESHWIHGLCLILDVLADQGSECLTWVNVKVLLAALKQVLPFQSILDHFWQLLVASAQARLF